MATIKQKDFVELEYTGKLKEDNQVFDTTDEKTAKEADIFDEKGLYGSAVICLGQNQLLAGLDNALEGKEVGKSYTFDLTAEEAFGKKDAKLLKMIPARTFAKQNIQPQPGLQVNIDGMMGTIRTATSGRVIVDFNHPLSGKDVVYEVKLKRIVTDDAEKVKKFLELQFQLKDLKVKVEDKTAKVTVFTEVPKEVQEAVTQMLKEIIPTVSKLEFIVEKKQDKETEKKKEEHKHGPDCKHNPQEKNQEKV